MKLYATSSNRANKVEGVGDNEFIAISLQRGNKYEFKVYYTLDGIVVFGENEKLLFEAKGKSQKGECKHFIIKDDYGKEYCQECGTYNNLN